MGGAAAAGMRVYETGLLACGYEDKTRRRNVSENGADVDETRALDVAASSIYSEDEKQYDK